MKEGATEFYTSRDNATLAVGQANFQAQIYKTAGKQAMLNAYAGAAGTLDRVMLIKAGLVGRDNKIWHADLDINE